MSKEILASWTWLLKKLRDAIDILDDLILIIDQGKIILKAIEEVFPENSNVNCFFHLKGNLGNLCKGKNGYSRLYGK